MKPETKKQIKSDMFILIVFISCIFFATNREHTNGRIEMCNEIGWKYLYNNECISNDEYQLKYNNTNKPNKDIFIQNKDIVINQEEFKVK